MEKLSHDNNYLKRRSELSEICSRLTPVSLGSKPNSQVSIILNSIFTYVKLGEMLTGKMLIHERLRNPFIKNARAELKAVS